MAATTLGLITTGTGPRDEYVTYHKNLLAHLGVEVDIEIRHALDGLTREEIRAIEAGPGDRVIGCHIKEEGGRGDRMGDDWGHVWIASQHLAPIYQKYVTELEGLGAAATILCCAEEYAVDAFHSSRFFVQPWVLMLEWVRVQTISMSKPTIGILIPDPEHYDQDLATWSSQSWMKEMNIVIESKQNRLDEACASFRKAGADLVINWGYGYGIAPQDPDGAVAAVEEASGAPFITPHRIATLFTRDLLRPSLDDRQFAPAPAAAVQEG